LPYKLNNGCDAPFKSFSYRVQIAENKTMQEKNVEIMTAPGGGLTLIFFVLFVFLFF